MGHLNAHAGAGEGAEMAAKSELPRGREWRRRLGRARKKGGEKMTRGRRILIRRCGEWGGVVAWMPSDWDRAVGREGVRRVGGVGWRAKVGRRGRE